MPLVRVSNGGSTNATVLRWANDSPSFTNTLTEPGIYVACSSTYGNTITATITGGDTTEISNQFVTVRSYNNVSISTRHIVFALNSGTCTLTMSSGGAWGDKLLVKIS